MNIIYNPYTSKCENGEILLYDEPTCESCGDLEPFDVTFAWDGTWWCEWCFKTFDTDLEVDFKTLSELERIQKADYYFKMWDKYREK